MAQLQYEYEHSKRSKFCINDQIDLLIEILKRLDGDSLAVAACVCRQWCALTRNDSLWEHMCFRHVSPPSSGVRPVVVALGGYRRLYVLCVKPYMVNRVSLMRRVLSPQEVELWISLFCVEHYERSLGGGGGTSASPSLMFLRKAVNV